MIFGRYHVFTFGFSTHTSNCVNCVRINNNNNILFKVVGSRVYKYVCKLQNRIYEIFLVRNVNADRSNSAGKCSERSWLGIIISQFFDLDPIWSRELLFKTWQWTNLSELYIIVSECIMYNIHQRIGTVYLSKIRKGKLNVWVACT